MHVLEQQCWRFLITVIDISNCGQLHDLADKYDCPPLKLASFRVLQENDPSYGFAPVNWESNGAENIHTTNADSGLTGPGESSYYTNDRGLAAHVYEEYDDDDDRVPSILAFKRKSTTTDVDTADINEGASQYVDALDSHQLPPGSSAREVVKAWASRLQYVYEQCAALEASENQNLDNL